MIATKNDELAWSHMCQTLRLFGHMKDFSKSECLRVAKLLQSKVKNGNVTRVNRGRYKANWSRRKGR